MIDTKDTSDTSTQHDDAFQFDDFDTMEEHQDYTDHSAKAAGNMPPPTQTGSNYSGTEDFQKNPRKFIALGVVILLVIVFIVYHFFSGQGFLSDVHHAPAEVPVAVNPAVNVPAPPSAVAQMQSMLSDKMNTLDQTIGQQQQAITQLQGNVSAVQDSVTTLTNSVSGMATQLDAINQKLTKPVKKMAAASTPAPVNCVVQALVPGRAWLKCGGNLLTVSVGNDVPQHGTVVQIDLSAGQVTTTDGAVFSYDTNAN